MSLVDISNNFKKSKLWPACVFENINLAERERRSFLGQRIYEFAVLNIYQRYSREIILSRLAMDNFRYADLSLACCF